MFDDQCACSIFGSSPTNSGVGEPAPGEKGSLIGSNLPFITIYTGLYYDRVINGYKSPRGRVGGQSLLQPLVIYRRRLAVASTRRPDPVCLAKLPRGSDLCPPDHRD